MPSTVEQLSPSRVKITVEIPFTDLKPSLDKAYAEIAKTVNIPGFRRGKVPPMVIDQRFGRGVVLQEALNNSIESFYRSAVDENKLKPLAPPELEVTKLEDGDLVEFTAEVDVRPDFELPDFTGIKATVDALDVPDALVEEQIDALRKRFGSRETVERPAVDGDVTTIDLVATQDGNALDDATAEGLEYVIGSGQMLDGLDEAVTGLSAGESATFSTTLVGGPLKDEAADVTVTVSKVQSQTLPEPDDEFAQEASEFDTIAELRANIAERLTGMARLEQASQARDAVLETLVDSIDIAVPEQLLESEIAGRRDQITNQLNQLNLTLGEYLADNEDGQTEEEFWSEMEQRATQGLKAQIVLDKVGDDRTIGVDQNDLTQHIIRKAQTDNVPPQQVADHLQEHPHHIEEYMLEIRRGKALALIVESAEVTDSNGEVLELSRLREDGTLSDPADESDVEETTADDAVIEGTVEQDATDHDAAEPAEDTKA